MFLKSLTIQHGDGTLIREVPFRMGLNLIVDETLETAARETGNNVGKTTVLKLVDFCLGADAKPIYSDHENTRHEYKLVKNFLKENRVLITLRLVDSFSDADPREILIERNFLSRKHKIQRFNGEEKTDLAFKETLTDLLFPGHFDQKPTFRQIIGHNLRYTDQSLNNTLKNLNRFTRDDEYETLYLFLLGCDFEQGDDKQLLRAQIKTEENFKQRLEAKQTRSAYSAALDLLIAEIDELEQKKDALNLNPNFERDLDRLNQVKYELNATSAEIGRLKLRRELIVEAQRELRASASNIDLQQLKQLYEQASAMVTGLQKTFEDLYAFHNKMVESKARFIAKDLPLLEEALATKRAHMKELLTQQKALQAVVTQSDSFDDLEKLITELNKKYYLKGEYESLLGQLEAVEARLSELNRQLTDIDKSLFSDDFAEHIQKRVRAFNRYFADVSFKLYGEKWALKFDKKVKKGRPLYEFSAFNTNFGSGKKQGEITCFDIAYTLFADEANIPCMHFLLSDKKELMHDNQLLGIARLVEKAGIQFVVPILKDKLPAELNQDENIVLRLSQENKLFRIESSGDQ